MRLLRIGKHMGYDTPVGQLPARVATVILMQSTHL